MTKKQEKLVHIQNTVFFTIKTYGLIQNICIVKIGGSVFIKKFIKSMNYFP